MVEKEVLIISTTSLCRDGLTAVLIRIAEIIRKQYHVSFALAEVSEQEIVRRLEKIGTVYHLPSRTHCFPAYLLRLSRLAKLGHYDIVHIHGNSATMAFDLAVTRYRKIPMRITHTHNAAQQPRLKQMILKPLVNRYVTDPVACSKLAGQMLYDQSFTVITNGIDCDRFRFSQRSRQQIRDELGIPQDAFVIGHIGRFTIQKNQRRLISIYSELLKKRRDSFLLLCGTGEDLPACQKQAEKISEKGPIIFTGIVNNPEKYYSAMDVLVMPSLFEGLPLVGIEAQASGLPCVLSDTISHETKILDQVVFLPLSLMDRDWVEKILKLKPGDRRSAREIVKLAGYSIEAMTVQIKKLYSIV